MFHPIRNIDCDVISSTFILLTVLDPQSTYTFLSRVRYGTLYNAHSYEDSAGVGAPQSCFSGSFSSATALQFSVITWKINFDRLID